MRWDIFCTVIDNFGDIAIAWRLSADLAGRGEQVRLWIDDPSALAWLAPEGCPGVEVRRWSHPLGPRDLADLPASEVWIEAFGCDIPPEFIAARTPEIEAGGARPVWLNLEYLSAEAYVERSHALPSPVRDIPVAGGSKWFFYPGFTHRTGGLLREPDLLPRQASFDRAAWLAALAPRLRPEPLTAPARPAGTRLVSLFCYEPAALPQLLRQLDQADAPTHLLVTSGRATRAVESALGGPDGFQASATDGGRLSISYVPVLTQRDYDHLLWACDLNFVRGEDSIVRALWAGQPFIWQIYPQEDGVHHLKLEAFLNLMQVPASLRQMHAVWNENRSAAALAAVDANLAQWRLSAEAMRTRLLAQQDLVTQLLQFVLEKR